MAGVGRDSLDHELPLGDADGDRWRLSNSSDNRPTTPATAGTSDGWPGGYMAYRCTAIDSSTKNSDSSCDRAACLFSSGVSAWAASTGGVSSLVTQTPA